MKATDYLRWVVPRAIAYRLADRGLWPAPPPIALTFSVTAACQSRCLTCHIGDEYLAHPEIRRKDLSLAQIEKVFRSLGPVLDFNVSGGEPFMRPDLAEIVRLACVHLRPRLIHLPTDALAPAHIERTVLAILRHMDAHLPAQVPLAVKPSIDGVGEHHDRIRGVPGNFRKLEETVARLLALRAREPRLLVDVGTVVSNHNIDRLGEIEAWVHARGFESFRHEIAGQRAEFHNLGDPITPDADAYEAVARRFANGIRRNIGGKTRVTRMTEAVRLAYYDLAVRILRERRQVTTCFAGRSNVHLAHDGEVWPCCVLGGERSLGRVQDFDYDLFALLRSPKAAAARRFVFEGGCACPLASQWLVNAMLTPRHVLRALVNYWQLGRPGGGATSRDRRRATTDVARTRPRPADGTTSALVSQRYGTLPAPRRVRLPVVSA